eukprot:m.978406 g.978406  ORF g.978406 m.978406 type:complete len:399 (-) comp23957_c0_seq1:3555-4751(-)
MMSSHHSGATGRAGNYPSEPSTPTRSTVKQNNNKGNSTQQHVMMGGQHVLPSSQIPSVSIGDEAFSIFGEHGENFMEDLMKTDSSILEGITNSGSIETLLGSVYSPARLPGLDSPQVSNALLSPGPLGMGMSAYGAIPLSPHMEAGHVRRSARLTPTRIYANADHHHHLSMADHHRPSSSKRPARDHLQPSFRKTLKMGAGSVGSHNDFDDFTSIVMEPLSPLTPYLKHTPPGGSKRILSSDRKGGGGLNLSGSKGGGPGSGSKRGEYKCGKCGFFPKKTKHDCKDFKLKGAAAGGSAVAGGMVVGTPGGMAQGDSSKGTPAGGILKAPAASSASGSTPSGARRTSHSAANSAPGSTSSSGSGASSGFGSSGGKASTATSGAYPYGTAPVDWAREFKF